MLAEGRVKSSRQVLATVDCDVGNEGEDDIIPAIAVSNDPTTSRLAIAGVTESSWKPDGSAAPCRFKMRFV